MTTTLYEIGQDAEEADALLDEHLTATEGEITPEAEGSIESSIEFEELSI